MLTRLAVRNFKSISDEGVVISPKPLTVLVGPNGSGKSSTIEAFALLAQSVGLLGLQPKGDLFSVGDRLDPLTHRGDTRRQLSIAIGMSEDVTTVSRGKLSLVKERLYGYNVILAFNEFEQELAVVDHKEDVSRILTRAFSQNLGEGRMQTLVRYPAHDGSLYNAYGDEISRILGQRVYAPAGIYSPDSPSIAEIQEDITEAETVCEAISRQIKGKVAFLSALRGEVPEITNVGAEPRWIGRKSENLVHLISVIFGRRKFFEARDKIIHWSSQFGLPGLSAGYQGGEKIGADFEEPRFRTPLGLNLASQGSRQVLSVIVQLFAGEPGDIVMIEEPEISLHPEAQVKLVELFADAIAWGKQIIFTTHSHYLLLAITRAVQRGLLTSDQLAIYEIKHEDERGSVATELPVSESGVIDGWVSSFASVDLELLTSRSS